MFFWKMYLLTLFGIISWLAHPFIYLGFTFQEIKSKNYFGHTAIIVCALLLFINDICKWFESITKEKKVETKVEEPPVFWL